jgi:hypothetical protein
LKIDRLRERAHQERLTEARHAFEERVAICQEAGQNTVDDRLIAYDDLADLLFDPTEARVELGGLLLNLLRRFYLPAPIESK